MQRESEKQYVCVCQSFAMKLTQCCEPAILQFKNEKQVEDFKIINFCLKQFTVLIATFKGSVHLSAIVKFMVKIKENVRNCSQGFWKLWVKCKWSSRSGPCLARVATTWGPEIPKCTYSASHSRPTLQQSRIVWLLKTPYKLSNVRSQQSCKV